MKKIKVAFILSGLGHINRGAEVVFTELTKRLSLKNDLEISVFGGGKNFNVENVKYIKVPCIKRQYLNYLPRVKHLHLTHNHDYEGLFFSLPVTLNLLMKKFDIISFYSFPFDLLPLKTYKLIRNKEVKSVFTCGGGSAFLMSRYFYADKVIAQSPESQRLFSKKFSTELIPCGVDTSIFKPQQVSRKEFDLPDDKFIIFSSSAFNSIKRLDFLIKVASKIKNAYLLFSGSGPQEKYLKELGLKLMGNNIKFLGTINQKMLVKYYNLCDVFCLPSKIEPFGIVLIEAMACQKPVVTNNSDTQRWIVANGGRCINVDNIEDMIQSLEEYKNENRASQTGEKGRKNVLTRFSWDRAAESYYKIFKELIIK